MNFRFGLVLFCLLSGSAILCRSQSVSSVDNAILNRVVSVKQFDIDSVRFLREFGRREKIKIGCCCSLSDNHRMTIEINGGTIRDVLDNYVAQNPGNNWSISNGVITIAPTERPKLLDLKIEKVEFKDLLFEDAGFAALELPEVADYLRENGLRSAKIAITVGSVDAESTVCLKLANTTFGTFLDEVLRRSNAQFWIFDFARKDNPIVRVLFQ